MSPRKVYSVSNDEVYFGHSACPSSWAGVVDNRELCITESGIADFIRGSNPQLFDSLRGLPVASSSLEDDDVVVMAREDLFLDYPQSIKPKMASIERGGSRFPFTSLPDFDQTWEAGFVRERPKEVVLTIVDSIDIGNLTYTYHRHHDDCAITCTFPFCSLKNHVIPSTNSFTGVRRTTTDENETSQLMDFYCLGCLNYVLKDQVDVFVLDGFPTQEIAASFDGIVDQAHVLQAAERLHPGLKHRELWKMYYPTEPPLEAGEGSNSKRGLRLRRQKQYEIERILQKVKKDKYAMAGSCNDTKPGSLVLTRPRYLPPYGDRYKKQGREWSDRTGHDTTPASSAIVDQPIPNGPVSCYCCEPDDGSPVVQCGSDKCMFGLIHFRCTDLEEMLTEEDIFFCQYCQDEVHAKEEMAKMVEAQIQARTWADMAPSDADNEGSDMDDDDETEYHDDEAQHERTTAASGFVAINSVSRYDTQEDFTPTGSGFVAVKQCLEMG